MHTEVPVHDIFDVQQEGEKKRKQMQNGASLLLFALVLPSHFADVEPVLMLTLHSNWSR
jgi:hypothetical protein